MVGLNCEIETETNSSTENVQRSPNTLRTILITLVYKTVQFNSLTVTESQLIMYETGLMLFDDFAN